jgi:hypothetical protein
LAVPPAGSAMSAPAAVHQPPQPITAPADGMQGSATGVPPAKLHRIQDGSSAGTYGQALWHLSCNNSAVDSSYFDQCINIIHFDLSVFASAPIGIKPSLVINK